MLDIDAIFLNAYDYDSECFYSAIEEVMGIQLTLDWCELVSLTDVGFLEQLVIKQGFADRKVHIIRDIKSCFLSKLRAHIQAHRDELSVIPGAVAFLNEMKSNPDIALAFVTRGWEQSARMKLNAIGVECSSQAAFASCADATTRSEIMALAAFRAKQNTGVIFERRVYFGDDEWDKLATSTLGYEFIAVGHKVDHHLKIKNFLHCKHLLSHSGLLPNMMYS